MGARHSEILRIPEAGRGCCEFAEDEEGTLLIGNESGVQRLLMGSLSLIASGEPSESVLGIPNLARPGWGLWIRTLNNGLIHLHQGKLRQFFAGGWPLRRYLVQDFFEDREGNIWVATLDGLDRFRRLCRSHHHIQAWASNGTVFSVLAGKDGSVWIGSSAGLDRWRARTNLRLRWARKCPEEQWKGEWSSARTPFVRTAAGESGSPPSESLHISRMGA